MRKLEDFECLSCGFKWESLVADDHDYCPQCGEHCKKIITGCNFKLEPVSGDFPTATERWAKMHEKEGRDTVRLARQGEFNNEYERY